jgi:hypothetical protein
MFKAVSFKTIITLCFLSIATVACTDSSDDTVSPAALGAGLLKYVPADSPYVFAMLDPLPDAVADKLEPKVDAILKSYQGLLHQFVKISAEVAADAEGEDGLPEESLAALQEFGSLLSIEGLRSIGIERDSTAVLYGAGLLPVLRMTLSDGALFDAAIARIEENAQGSMTVATIDGQSYRYAGDDEGRLIIAVIENEFVVSLVPTNLSDDLLKSVLGLTLPSSSMADSGELHKIIDVNGFLSHSIGMIDIERIVATFLDDQSGVNKELLALMEYDDSELDDICKAEIREMGGIVPRIVTGYTEMSVDQFVSNTILELRDDIAAGLAALPAPVPGLGSEQGGVLSFGMSINLVALREFYEARLDAIEADPYECELFADIQDGVAQGRESLNQPIPPIVYGFKGFLAVVEDIQGMDLANNMRPTGADLRLLVTTDNAAGLLAMGAMFSPEIAGLDIKPDGVPVKFESQQMAGMVGAAYVAMTDTALALSIGDGVEARLGDMMSAAVNEPHPFMSMEMDSTRYYEFIGQTMQMEKDGDDDEEDEAAAEIKAAMSEIMVAVGDMFSRMTFQVYFTEHGVEFPSTIELAE